jgi:tryptophanyl-tRNA synthetase
MTGETKAEVLACYAGQGFGVFKPALAEVVADRLGPVSAELNRLLADPAEIDRVLRDGAERAAAVAEPVLEETRRAVGFWR